MINYNTLGYILKNLNSEITIEQLAFDSGSSVATINRLINIDSPYKRAPTGLKFDDYMGLFKKYKQRYFGNDPQKTITAITDILKTISIDLITLDEQFTLYINTPVLEEESFEQFIRLLIFHASLYYNKQTPIQHDIVPPETKSNSVKDWRILSAAELVSELNMSPMDISARILENDRALYDQLPAECAGTQQQWANIFTAFGEHCRFLLDSNDDIQGNYSIYGLSPEQEKSMIRGTLIDSELNFFDCDHLQTAGDHAVYLLNLSVNSGVGVAQYSRLWEDFISHLKDCAKKKIFFRRIYYKAFLPEHASAVIGRGFEYSTDDATYGPGRIFVHNMDETTLRVLDEELAALYRERNSSIRNDSSPAVSTDRLEAEAVYLSLFREIDDLFVTPRFCVLKPYFFNGLGIPKNDSQKALGIATAELLRDILQYCAAFLPYLPENRQRTYNEYRDILHRSLLIQASKGEYQFTTENGSEYNNHIGYSLVSVYDIAMYARIWIGIDKLFLREDILPMRRYFYEQSDHLPDADEMDAVTAVAIRILSGMIISEGLINRIPHQFVISYFDYKERMKTVRIIQKVISENLFLKDELEW